MLALTAGVAPVTLTGGGGATGSADESTPATAAPILMESPTKDSAIATGVRLDDGRELVLYYDLGLELGGRDAYGLISPLPLMVATMVEWRRPTTFDSLIYDARTIGAVGGIRPDRRRSLHRPQ